ncbi:MAG TPA: peptidase MA family metallohydrolase [Polyangiales bacterium]
MLRACTRAWLAWVLMGSLGAGSVLADADDDPPDVVTASAPDVALPDPPVGFLHKRIGNVEWDYHERNAELARSLQAKLESSWRQVVSELGRPVPDQLTIRIARGPEDMQRLAPRNNPPPSYAVGVAYPSLGLIILSVVSPDSWFPPDQAAVLTHELSHVALHRAVDGRPLPLWFVEGLATYQAGEHRLARVRALWEATVSGDVLPLELVSRSFPNRAHAVNLAYAQSADLVRHLLQSSADRSRLSHLLEQVARGVGFEQALLSAYRIDLPFLEREWRQGLNERFRVLPLVLTGTALWGGIALLAIVAFARRRQQNSAKLARWEAEEAAEQARALVAATTPTVPVQARPTSEPRIINVYALPPPVREAGVPTVEHDGQRHTLH